MLISEVTRILAAINAGCSCRRELFAAWLGTIPA
jgi:hypothetical protein